jgi:hypothetical protein
VRSREARQGHRQAPAVQSRRLLATLHWCSPGERPQAVMSTCHAHSLHRERTWAARRHPAAWNKHPSLSRWPTRLPRRPTQPRPAAAQQAPPWRCQLGRQTFPLQMRFSAPLTADRSARFTTLQASAPTQRSTLQQRRWAACSGAKHRAAPSPAAAHADSHRQRANGRRAAPRGRATAACSTRRHLTRTRACSTARCHRTCDRPPLQTTGHPAAHRVSAANRHARQAITQLAVLSVARPMTRPPPRRTTTSSSQLHHLCQTWRVAVAWVRGHGGRAVAAAAKRVTPLMRRSCTGVLHSKVSAAVAFSHNLHCAVRFQRA